MVVKRGSIISLCKKGAHIGVKGAQISLSGCRGVKGAQIPLSAYRGHILGSSSSLWMQGGEGSSNSSSLCIQGA